jgi:exodeoxyribonuclease VIII
LSEKILILTSLIESISDCQLTARFLSGGPKMPILPTLAAALYHNRPELSHSQLKDFSQSPWDFWMRHKNPLRPVRTTSTAAQNTGEILHCAILEPHRFVRDYAAGPDVSRATKEWKFADAEAKEQGKTLLKLGEWQEVVNCADSVRSHPLARKILEEKSLQTEVSATWEIGDVKCRGRFDGMTDWCLADLKTSSKGSPIDFMWQAEKYSYHTQAAYYQMGHFRATEAQEQLPFMFIVFETEYPFKCYVYRTTTEFLERGRAMIQKWLAEYSDCLQRNKWPCDNGSLIELTPPPNAKWRDSDDDL